MSPDLGHLQDGKTQDAVLWRLAVIGEEANNTTSMTRESISLPWSQIIGMRHVAIHHYRKLDMRRIWTTVNDRIPELAAAIENFLREIP